jgi:hypothetical protein
MIAHFAITRVGKRIHITDDNATTRCGWPVDGEADADDVLWFGVCEKCRRDR